MKIFMWWGDESGGVVEPHALSLGAPPGDTCYIARLITDDGGSGFEKTISEASKVLESIKKMREGLAECCYWSRETFCADISRHHVKISSQYLEDYFDIMTLDEFEGVLFAWYDMLMAGPQRFSARIETDIHPKQERPSP